MGDIVIHALLFDHQYNAVDVLHLKEFSSARNVYNVTEFTATVVNIEKYDIQDEYFISLFQNGNCAYSGVIKYVSVEDGKISGFDAKYCLQYHLYCIAFSMAPVAEKTVSGSIKTIFHDVLKAAFGNGLIIEFDPLIEDETVQIDVRMKYLFEILKKVCILKDITYEIFILGNGSVKAIVRKMVDRSNSVVLIAGITHQQISKIRDTRNYYNQLIGLGSGEGSERDYYLIDQSSGSQLKRCYIYDLRQNVSHDELVQECTIKYKEISSEYYAKFSIQDNNLAQLGKDYFLGDQVIFTGKDGERHKDMISEISLKMQNGSLKSSYEVTVGTGKRSMTSKINDLKEGGYT